MQIPKVLLDEEKAEQFFKYAVAFSCGSIVTSLIGMYGIKRGTKKLKERIRVRNEMVKNYREEIRRIRADVTLSADEREDQIDTIIKFVQLILDQDLT